MQVDFEFETIALFNKCESSLSNRSQKLYQINTIVQHALTQTHMVAVLGCFNLSNIC